MADDLETQDGEGEVDQEAMMAEWEAMADDDTDLDAGGGEVVEFTFEFELGGNGAFCGVKDITGNQNKVHRVFKRETDDRFKGVQGGVIKVCGRFGRGGGHSFERAVKMQIRGVNK